jgi:vesicle coat complex subunit
MKTFSFLLFINFITVGIFADNTQPTVPLEFYNICGDIYNEFNKDRGPDQIVLLEKIDLIRNHATDKNIPGNDLFAGLLAYFMYGDSRIDLAIQAIDEVMSTINDKYRMFVSPLLFLFFGECIIKYNEYEMALNVFQNLKEIHLNDSRNNKNKIASMRIAYANEPTRIADYYIAYLKDKIDNTNENIDKFKEKYPNFWRLN